MTIRAYVLIEAETGTIYHVRDALKGAPGVTSVDVVAGPYDLIAVLEADDLAAVGRAVTNDVHGARGIIRTTTCLAVER